MAEKTESNFVTWAREELSRAGLFDSDSDYEGMLGDAVMKMVETFADEGHSGFSAAYAASIFDRLVRWQPLTPITDNPDEWMVIAGDDPRNASEETIWQSRRAPGCFSRDGGTTYYDIDEKLAGWRRWLSRVSGIHRPKIHRSHVNTRQG